MTSLHANITPGIYNWIGTSAGHQGLGFNYAVRKHSVMVELYIDRGKEAEEENLAILNHFLDRKDDIEASFGEALEWQELDGRRACRIRKTIEIGGYQDTEKWDQIQQEMIESMIKLEAALRPVIRTLPALK